ncbi:MAG: hypothetical protein AABW84_01895 [Nanoarchaeota archaeon]
MNYTNLYGVGSCKSANEKLEFLSVNQILIDNKNSAIYILCITDNSYAIHGKIKFGGKVNISKLDDWPFTHHVALRADSLDELIIFCKDIQHRNEIDNILDLLIKKY